MEKCDSSHDVCNPTRENLHVAHLVTFVVRGIAECCVDCRRADERSESCGVAADGAIVQVVQEAVVL